MISTQNRHSKPHVQSWKLLNMCPEVHTFVQSRIRYTTSLPIVLTTHLTYISYLIASSKGIRKYLSLPSTVFIDSMCYRWKSRQSKRTNSHQALQFIGVELQRNLNTVNWAMMSTPKVKGNHLGSSLTQLQRSFLKKRDTVRARRQSNKLEYPTMLHTCHRETTDSAEFCG